MAIIPQLFMNAVVALGIESPDKTKHWIGTGFIVGRKEKNNPKLSTHYIITNKHVVNGRNTIFVRFNSTEGEFVKDYSINLIDKNGTAIYSAHPNNATDIIAFQIIPQTLIKDGSIWGSFDLEDNALTLEQMRNTGIEEGTLVYALGFPMNIVDDIKAPICRLGCISRVFDAFLLAKNGNPTYLVDAQTFPGNSGGPIVNRPEHMSIAGTVCNSSANLIGILSGYVTYRATLVSQQTDELRMIHTEKSGLTTVPPVDRIKEVVELEWKRCGGKEETNCAL